MSGSEGKQNNRLSQKDIEAEEMAQELMGMAMYEEGMGYEQMKEILEVINESKHMAGIKPDNRSSQEIIEFLPDITISKIPSKSNSHIILDGSSIPKPTFSYRQASGRASSPLSGRRSILDDAIDESRSPELFTIDEPKRTSSEAEAMDDSTKDTEAKDQEVPTRTRSKNEWPSLPGSSAENNERDKSKKNQRTERWKMDPLDAVVDENDVPLREREKTTAEERVPFIFCHNKRVLEEPKIGEKVMTVLAYTLEEEADIWRRSRRPEVTEFQWGLPIKVGSNIRYTDKKTVTEDADSPPRPSVSRLNHNSIVRRSMDRNCKRKAVEYIKDLVEDQIDSDDSGENIFDVVKKVKTTDKPWEPMTRSNFDNRERNMTRREKMFSNMNSGKEQDSQIVGEYDSDEYDNDDLSTLFRRSRNKVKENSRPASPVFVPRRVVPPIPGAPKPRAPRRQTKKNVTAKRKSPLRKNAQATFERNQNSEVTVVKGRGRNAAKTVTLNDDEIMSELENDTADVDEVEFEVKPKPVKGLAGKLQIVASKLIETKNAEERMEKLKNEEKQRIEQEEKMRMQDIQIQRFLKEQQEKKEREDKEAQIKAKEETYRKNEAIRDRDRRRRAMQQKKGVLLMDDEEIGEAIIHSIDDDQMSNNELLRCPICELEFSLQEIENHAAECEQYDRTDKPGPSRSEADNDVTITNEDTIFDCLMCSKFSTSNPIAYEEHVNACKNRLRNGKGSPPREVIEVPTSPIKCFVPISEQTGSSINYAEQFPNRNFHKNVNFKRRNRN